MCHQLEDKSIFLIFEAQNMSGRPPVQPNLMYSGEIKSFNEVLLSHLKISWDQLVVDARAQTQSFALKTGAKLFWTFRHQKKKWGIKSQMWKVEQRGEKTPEIVLEWEMVQYCYWCLSVSICLSRYYILDFKFYWKNLHFTRRTKLQSNRLVLFLNFFNTLQGLVFWMGRRIGLLTSQPDQLPKMGRGPSSLETCFLSTLMASKPGWWGEKGRQDLSEQNVIDFLLVPLLEREREGGQTEMISRQSCDCLPLFTLNLPP